MPATVCTLAVSLVLQVNDAEGGRDGRCTGAEQLVPPTANSSLLKTIVNLSACAEMSGIPRPSLLHKIRKS